MPDDFPKLDRSSPDHDAWMIARRDIKQWLLKALEGAVDQSATLPDMRPLVWEQMPGIVRASPAALWVGHDMSRKLKSTKGIFYNPVSGIYSLKDPKSKPTRKPIPTPTPIPLTTIQTTMYLSEGE